MNVGIVVRKSRYVHTETCRWSRMRVASKKTVVKPNLYYFKSIDVKAHGKARLVLINDVSATATPLRF